MKIGKYTSLLVVLFAQTSSSFSPITARQRSAFLASPAVSTPTRQEVRQWSTPSLNGEKEGSNDPIFTADDEDDAIYDVAIIGSGPAACSLAALLTAPNKAGTEAASSTPKVVVLSKFADKRWVPNYGCWTEEWAALDELYTANGVPGLMALGVDTQWSDTDCFFGEQSEGVFDKEIEGSHRRTVGK